ncbi:MAG TPA: hypothetical protein VL737_03515 [Candidatus Pristimantibacillus sp.]|jgi:hypothetical protein|nr:hypothetical protein [Candidatus Pristimantibacillus sp.]
MLFRKKKSIQEPRRRQPGAAGLGSAQPVFSYHARSSRTEPGGKRSSKLLWLAPSKPPSPRPKASNLRRRTVLIVFTVLALVLVANCLVLNRNASIVILNADAKSAVFLSSQEAYKEAADSILASSLANTTKPTADIRHLADQMKARFPEIDNVTVTLPVFGHSPTFYLQPARPALLLKTIDGGLFIIDQSGRALVNASQARDLAKLGLVVAEDQTGLPVTLGKTALPSINVQFISDVLVEMQAKKVAVTGVVLPKATNEVDLRVAGVPYLVKFNLRGDARAEAGTYLATKQYLESRGKTPGEYVDVRVDGKAYYR